MVVIKARSATKRLGPISLGRTVTRFKTKNNGRHYTVHEGLCQNFNTFKQRLQKDCKAVDSESSICAEDLDPKIDDITFCRAKCGQGVHTNCKSGWNDHKPAHQLARSAVRARSGRRPTCLDWLYTCALQFDERVKRDGDEFNIVLLKAWNVSEGVKDESFRHSLVAEYCGHADVSGFRTESAKYTFGPCGTHLMQEFFLDAFLDEIEPDWLQSQIK
ncbi:hypothetical protein EJ02DRAFT_471714 [Clathrospora elynae]|uniref:Uncharacterized protein n=1 Tax=Clathrospora elynae TaxID=706981 RepID=A0A6A5SB66_9PLEO|nr:hypothetical protein EJ02DRAFT_471714 [Clathrospora elynae]